MKKNILFLMLVSFSVLTLSSCKKDYSCKATASGEESIFKCENCSKKDLEDYETSIKDAGYTSVSCEK